MGNEVLARAAKNAGAKLMFGYPITPSSEIMAYWAEFCQKDKTLSILQTEDEMAAGFGTIGACLAGKPAFTATAGPGNILMQDAFSMAEALKIPLVALIVQRGGLSTSTVIYSQEEVRLTTFGGNGEGFRLVYSTSGLQDLYDYTLKAFANAWKYRLPTFVLADGYQGKMMGKVEIPDTRKNIHAGLILKKGVNLRNCYNLEEEINAIIDNYQKNFEKIRAELEEAEIWQTTGASTIVLSHGIVAAAAKIAVEQLRNKGRKVGFFRPITLRPFPKQKLNLIKHAKKIVVIESALGQLQDLYLRETTLSIPVISIFRPAKGLTPAEIYHELAKIS